MKKTSITCILAICAMFLLAGQVRAGEAIYGEWLLNDGSGTVAADSSGYGNNAILTGTATWGSGCFNFNGSNYFVVSHSASTFKIDMTKSFTISAAVQTTQMNYGCILSRQNNNWVPGGKTLYISGGYFHFAVGWVGDIGGSTFISDGLWHVVTVTYNASSGVVQTTVDGYADATATWPGISTYPDNFDLYIGVQNAWANFTGSINDIYIYQFPTNAYNPSPANGNTGVSATVNHVSWQTPDSNDKYNVYFSTSQADVNSNASAAQIGTNLTTLSAPVTLAIGQTYYWKVNCVEPNSTVIPGNIWSFSTVSYKAYNPSPASGSTTASIYSQLGWTAGLSATSHKVYLSKALADVNQGLITPVTVTTNSYNPGTLKLNTTYYWRVDEVAGGTTTSGDIWTFTTNSTEMIDTFGYFSTAALQAAWVGPGTNVASAQYYRTWMEVPYSTGSQTFTRTFTTALDFSTAAVLTMQYRQVVASGLPGAALVTVSLLDASNNVLLSSQLSDPNVNWPTNGNQPLAAVWNIPTWSQRANLTAVKKISITVSGVTSPGASDAFFVANMGLTGPVCTTAIPGDLNGDCQVTFADFAIMAQSWLACNRTPQSSCFSY